MKKSIVYTVVTAVGLIVFAVISAMLPGQVSVHYAAGTVDRMGTVWWLLAFPAAAALIALAAFVVTFFAKPKSRPYIVTALFAVGGTLATVGWVYLALAAQGASFGEHVDRVPFAATALALSLAEMLAGSIVSDAFPAVGAENGPALAVAGGAGYLASLIVMFAAPRLDYLSLVVFAVTAAAALLVFFRRKIFRGKP